MATEYYVCPSTLRVAKLAPEPGLYSKNTHLTISRLRRFDFSDRYELVTELESYTPFPKKIAFETGFGADWFPCDCIGVVMDVLTDEYVRRYGKGVVL